MFFGLWDKQMEQGRKLQIICAEYGTTGNQNTLAEE